MNVSNRNFDDNDFQRDYYSKTASVYDSMHLDDEEHKLALSVLIGLIDYLDIQSILDIGSGTGRAIRYIKKHKPEIELIGIEPVKELREIGYREGISKDELINGDALNLEFGDNQFDLVCEFGALHHIRKTDIVVSEMLRVAKKAIFISDCNNFGQGSFMVRTIKQAINIFGLWKTADWIKTKGKGYKISEEDGLAYSYSVYNNYEQINKSCRNIHIFNTKGTGINPYRAASHVCLLGVK